MKQLQVGGGFNELTVQRSGKVSLSMFLTWKLRHFIFLQVSITMIQPFLRFLVLASMLFVIKVHYDS